MESTNNIFNNSCELLKILKNPITTNTNEYITMKNESHQRISNSTFNDLQIKESIIRSLNLNNFVKPSEIQEMIIPTFNKKQNIICQSMSGTGKTLSFVIGVLNNIEPLNKVQAIVVTVSYELTKQIFSVFKKIIESISTNGNDNFKIEMLRKDQKFGQLSADILIATPGTFGKALRYKSFETQNVKLVVLDEADALLNLQGLASQTTPIINKIMPARLCFFSATYNPATLKYIKKFVGNDVVENLTTNEKPEKIYNFYIGVPQKSKTTLLMDLTEYASIGQVIVFVSTKKKVKELGNLFISDMHSVGCIHGDLTIEERNDVLNKFAKNESRVLISSDIICRGVDILQVNLIINFDLPPNIDFSNDSIETTYLHRIGRSGRYGRSGAVIDFISTEDEMVQISNIYEKLNIEPKEVTIEEIAKAFDLIENK